MFGRALPGLTWKRITHLLLQSVNEASVDLCLKIQPTKILCDAEFGTSLAFF